jgi:soluble lytic murein transglycosylase-like protein
VTVFLRSFVVLLVLLGLTAVTGVGHAETTGPRTAMPAANDAAPLPRVLSDKDVALYRRIFALGEQGKWQAADELIEHLQDRLLLGHVLAQRYLHPTAYRSRYKELNAWLARYADQPDAERIHELALQRRPKDGLAPRPPVSPTAVSGGSWAPRRATPAIPAKRLGAADRKKASVLERRIDSRLRNGWTKSAKQLVVSPEAERLLSRPELDRARARLGHGYFIDGRDEWALEWTSKALERSARYLPEAHWTAGLANWRLGRFALAADHFEAVARRRDVSAWMASAAAFWSARSHLFARRPDQVNRWLAVAASHPRTFYGLLAVRILGLPSPLRWEPSASEAAALKTLSRLPAGRRALALIQVGQRGRAEQELRGLAAAGGADLARGIMAAAGRGGLPGLAMRLHNRLYADSAGFDAAAYPLPKWKPKGGFHVDRALVYAVVRQESRFDPDAKSWAGARGLMQLMPSTARFVARGSGYRLAGRGRLYDPGLNLALGQRYLEMLLGDGNVDGDLFRLAAAWNGGPGNLQKWRRETKHGNDPLLFIESIPSLETRVFIERLLANLWIYRDRMGQPAPSLDALAAGNWPVYTALDHNRVEVAQHGQN